MSSDPENQGYMRNGKSARKNIIFRICASVVIITICLFTMQSFKWYKAGNGMVVKEQEQTKMPLDSLVSPQPGVTVYKRIDKEVTYTRGTFPTIQRVEKIVKSDYYAEND